MLDKDNKVIKEIIKDIFIKCFSNIECFKHTNVNMFVFEKVKNISDISGNFDKLYSLITESDIINFMIKGSEIDIYTNAKTIFFNDDYKQKLKLVNNDLAKYILKIFDKPHVLEYDYKNNYFITELHIQRDKNMYDMINLTKLYIDINTSKNAFGNSQFLEEVYISKCVTKISPYAFKNCFRLKKVVIEGDPVISYSAFDGCEPVEIEYLNNDV